MNDSKKVSVIIPFYSNVKWLYEAVESVLSQTYKNLEIILVNDGSKENLSDFLEKYGHSLIYLEQENSGPGAARNNGIRHATGDYIAFQDSDDIWLPTKLEKQVAFMIKSDTRWNHTGFYYWNPESDTLKEVDCSRDYDDISIQRMVSTQIATPSVMIDRCVYNEGNFYFPESIRNGEDDNLYTRLARTYKISLVEEPLVKVRLRGSNSNGKAIERFKLRKRNLALWESQGIRIPFMVKLIYGFYNLYAGIFPDKSNCILDFFAKCAWTIPYALERIYVRYLFLTLNKSEGYIMRKSGHMADIQGNTGGNAVNQQKGEPHNADSSANQHDS